MLLGGNGSLRSAEYGRRTFRWLYKSSCWSCSMCISILNWNLIYRSSLSRNFTLYYRLCFCYCYRGNPCGSLPKNQWHFIASFERRINYSLKWDYGIAIIKNWSKLGQLFITTAFIEIRQIRIYPPELDRKAE